MGNLKKTKKSSAWFLKQKNKGFTFLELLGAIFVISIGILAVYGVVSRIISYSSAFRSKLIAAYLAQEGIEIVRNIRDSNWLRGQTNLNFNWNDGLPEGDYEADYTATTFENADSAQCTEDGYCRYSGNFLKYDEDNGYNYTSTSGTPTKFKRKISISYADKNTDGEEEIIVTVTVEWQEKGERKTITATEILYNWVPWGTETQ